MQRVLTTQLPAHVGASVRVAGWVHRRRLLKSVAFLTLRDAAGLAQVVVTEPEARAAVEALTEETVVEVVATVAANPAAPAGVELTAPTVRPLGPPAVPPPFDLYRPALTAGLPTQLGHADYLAALASRGEPVEPYAGYVDAFRHGMPPHGGFAIGLERFVARLTGARNVREVTAFPRDLHRLTP
ncbi:amino acid--tRNA ligase-related protein [Micromonospora sp. NPDC047707]|uniref:amino acid--tRNA ligase-related protein n=1 Tax=Micromonospora sp. NPDC047707 TaxID=3154498 RepID=UPI003454207F